MAKALRVWLAALTLFTVVVFLPGLVEGRPPVWGEIVTAGISCGALPWCRRFPIPVLLVAWAGSLGSVYLTKLVFPAATPLLVVLYMLGTSYSVRLTATCTAAVVVTVFTQVQLVSQIPSFTLRNGTQLGWFVTSASIGVAVQGQRRYREMAEERARKAEESREADARRRVNDERLRIAQELHDAVGHSIAVINVQAGVAEHLVHKDPETAEKALALIRTTSGRALEEIRATLGLLRAAEPETQPRSPMPGLADIPALIEQARVTGLVIDHVQHGPARNVPAVVGISVYRLVQETLTNALKHAGPGTDVLVDVTFLEHSLQVTVEDNGAGQGGPGGGSGLGLRGMRERVEAAGGTLEASPRRPGFRVMAHIPTEAR
ncbi:sensor histidine kinase [Streptomyces sp. NPDC020800]|uniref:sensor histidine kinase n=1 Tax=Streptomyces sp. NPDC020800 TaxID=3365092 RepID=UPI003788D926